MKILIDMNLSPQWVTALIHAGFESNHWSEIGPSDTTDRVIMEWAVKNNYVIFTHDLDFGSLLA